MQWNKPTRHKKHASRKRLACCVNTFQARHYFERLESLAKYFKIKKYYEERVMYQGKRIPDALLYVRTSLDFHCRVSAAQFDIETS